MKKTTAILRWMFHMILALVISASALVIYPLAYILRYKLRLAYYGTNKTLRILSTPLWMYLDDEEFFRNGDDYGDAWWKVTNNINVNALNEWQLFVVSYKWAALRNPAWNQHRLFKPKDGDETLVEMIGSTSFFDWREFCELKWFTDGEYTDNQGECIAPSPYSIFGNAFIWFSCGGTLYWRYSFANYVPLINRWVELHLGSTEGNFEYQNKRYTWRMKIKKASLCNIKPTK